MAKLRHIAITVPDPWKAAEFYMRAFGMQKVGETTGRTRAACT
jgi:catechol 2,3-dioxygenase-like lactoylglutathione lyase family enzyme